jgi:threonine dehydrogenase-like Zn-dependent dehydrogenase
LHLLDGYILTMQSGDILGHEFMGEVVEVDRAITPDAATASSCRLRSCGTARFRAALVV